MAKKLEKMTADDLRSKFVVPLSRLAVSMQEEVEKLANAVRDGQLPYEHLEMNIQQGQFYLKKLNGFFQKELKSKLESALDGTYRWRLAEKKHARKTNSVKSKKRAAQ